ncbi:hypothetical protein B0T19DRAFT_164939 [Cercophora scortea]|uniref:Uncharacterized protein n=1 Tax=Cercophora scortea TaxID=314031 RepID=A0AAE0IM76_9PEZI|nr:hypothetical protein B0T19DRAFT_164939 [Cercophora scortea]
MRRVVTLSGQFTKGTPSASLFASLAESWNYPMPLGSFTRQPWIHKKCDFATSVASPFDINPEMLYMQNAHHSFRSLSVPSCISARLRSRDLVPADEAGCRSKCRGLLRCCSLSFLQFGLMAFFGDRHLELPPVCSRAQQCSPFCHGSGQMRCLKTSSPLPLYPISQSISRYRASGVHPFGACCRSPGPVDKTRTIEPLHRYLAVPGRFWYYQPTNVDAATYLIFPLICDLPKRWSDFSQPNTTALGSTGTGRESTFRSGYQAPERGSLTLYNQGSCVPALYPGATG